MATTGIKEMLRNGIPQQGETEKETDGESTHTSWGRFGKYQQLGCIFQTEEARILMLYSDLVSLSTRLDPEGKLLTLTYKVAEELLATVTVTGERLGRVFELIAAGRAEVIHCNTNDQKQPAVASIVIEEVPVEGEE